MIDKASVFAERFKSNPQILQATVLGQGTDPNLDPYTALRALQLIKESNAMAMAQQGQGPTSAPSLASQAVEPQGLAGMLPMGAPAGQMPQGQAPQQMGQAPAMQASGGLAGLPTPEEEYAAGGIVAFSGENGSLVTPAVSDDPFSRISASEEEPAGEGDVGMQARAFANYEASRKALEELTGQTTTADDDRKTRKDYLDFLKENAGPDIYAPAMGKLDTREADRAKNVRQGQGLALLAAAGAILEGNTLARGASKAFPVFAKEMGEVQRADIAEQRSIETMRFALADAQRKERMGDVRGAQAATETARKAKADANKFQFDKTKALADLDAKAIQATRPRTGAGAGGPKLAERLADAEEAFALNPTKENRARLQALSSAASKMKTSFSTSESGPGKLTAATAPVQQRVDAAISEAMRKFASSSAAGSAYRSAVRAGNTEEAERLFGIEEAKQRKIFEASENAVSGGGGSSSGKPKVIKLD
jgi:hypothetical protein